MPSYVGLPEGAVIEGDAVLQKPLYLGLPEGAVVEEKYTPADITSLKRQSWAGDEAAPGGATALLRNEPLQFIKDTVTNIPNSGISLLKGMAQPVLHPVDTASNIADLLYGGTVGQLTPVPETKLADAFGTAMKNRYGGMDEALNTVKTDPVGFLADLATVMTGAGGLARQVTSVPRLAAAGTKLMTTGAALDPVNMMMELGSSVAPALGKGAAEVLGATTGAGPEAIRRAFTGGQDFTDAMRGNTTAHEITQAAKDSVETLKQQRRDDYLNQLQQVANSNATLDLNPVLLEFDKQRRKFGIGRDNSGNLVFNHKTTLDSDAWNRFTEVDDLMKAWAADKNARTPLDFDTLKRRLDDLYTPNSNFRAALTPIKKTVKQQLLDNVQGYDKLTKDYEEATRLLDEINSTLSLGSKAMPDTTLRKLISTNREGFERRRDLLNQMDAKTGSDISGMAAGYQLNQIVPKGLVGKLLGGSAGLSGAYAHSPWMAAALFTSPRLMGETANIAGKTANALAPVAKAAQTPGMTVLRNLTMMPDRRMQYGK